jgi:hypothetical protein
MTGADQAALIAVLVATLLFIVTVFYRPKR